jgi:translation initiation factor IF-1
MIERKNELMENENEEKRTRLEFEGTVIESNKGIFKVQINESYVIQCTLSGKIRTNSVRILLGDLVKCEASEYDPSKGRIVYRIKGA